MSNDSVSGSKDAGRSANLASGSSADGTQAAPPRVQPTQTRAVVEPSVPMKANDSLAFRSDAPRDVAMPSSTSGSTIAELSKVQLSAFKSDAPRETRDHAMLASAVDRQVPLDALRIQTTPTELSAFRAHAPRDTARPSSSSGVGGAGSRRQERPGVTARQKASVFRRMWQFLRGKSSG